MESTIQSKPKSAFLYMLKGALIAIICSIFAVLVFAVILRFCDMSDTWIRVINQLIKAISIFLGCVIGLKKSKEHGLYKGIVIGLLYTILAFLVFSLLDRSFDLGISIFMDLCFGGIAGGVCGVINSAIRR